MFAVLLLLATGFGGPADHGALRGTVLFDDVHRPAAGATVLIVGTPKGAMTDAEGRFQFDNIPDGSYQVDVSYVGYRRERLTQVTVRAGETTELTVALKVAPFDLDAVVVTGTLNKHLLKDSPVLTEVIGERELAVIGSKNLSEVLQVQTGINVETGIGQTQNVSLHGLNDNHVLVLVDGERVSGKVDGAIDLGQVPIAMVDRIEVVKGPLSSIYGSDALGGVINILTRTPARSEATVAGTFGSMGRQDYAVSGSHVMPDLFGEGRSLRLIGNVSVNKFGGVDYIQRDNFSEMPATDRSSINLKSVAQVTPRLSLEVKADHYRDALNWLAGDIGITYLHDYSRNSKLSLTGAGTLTVSDDMTLKISAHKSQNDRRSWENTGAGYLTRDAYARELLQSYKVQSTLVPYAKSILTLGGEIAEESMNSSRFDGGLRSFNNRVLFAEDEWDLGLGTITIGGRLSDNSAFGAVLAPRVSAMVPVTANTTLRASYGRGYREPSLLELYIDFDHSTVGYVLKGDPNLKPEDSRGLTCGLQYNRGDLVWFRVTYFLNVLDNLIDYYAIQNAVPGAAAILSYRNVNHATTEGVDVDVDLALLEGTLFTVGYTHLRAVDDRGDPLPFRTPNAMNMKFNWRLPWSNSALDLRLRWVDRKPVNDDQVNRGIYAGETAPTFSYVPSYAIADVRLSARPVTAVEIFAGINNVSGVTQYPFGQIKPREFFLGTNVTIQ